MPEAYRRGSVQLSNAIEPHPPMHVKMTETGLGFGERLHGCSALTELLSRLSKHQIDSMTKERSIETAEGQKRARSCLSCHRVFDSAWVGERVCPRCKGSQTWRSATRS